MPVRLPLVSPLVVALMLTLAAGPAAAQRAPATPAACTDFYGHANAAWLAGNKLPANASSLSRWDQLYAQNQAQRDQVLSATTAPAQAMVSVRLADLFASAQDEAAIEAAGAKPLAPLLAIVDKIKRTRDVAPAIAALHAAGMPVLVDLQVLRDNTGTPYAQIGAGGIGLPDPGFYDSTDPLVQPVEKRYGAAVWEWLRLTGTPEAKLAEQVGWVMQMERTLAKATLTGTPFQVMSTKDASGVAGALELERLLAAHGLKASQVAMTAPGFFQALNQLIAKTKPEQWKVYLRAQIARDMAPTLSKGFNDPWGQLYEVTLAGQAAPTPRALRARWVLESRVPELLDAAYTQRFLPVPRQERAKAIAEAVRASAIASVDRAPWLSEGGKASARARLQAMVIQVGSEVPDNVFDDLKFKRNELAGNVLALRRWLQKYALVRARMAWPAEQWQPLVALLPQENRLVVTSGTLQPPILDDGGSAADFGGFGALVAQQLSLSLQTWDGPDAAAWGKRATPLIAQYNAYSATGGATKVNGTRSFAQNQADLAGLEIAWAALNAQGTPDAAASKAFFTGWANLWARQDKDTVLAAAQASAIHAPSKWRVNGPLSNLPAFGQAYGCKGKVPMQRTAKEQVALWR
ncbi:M13 family metallopeptidase [Arenimonas sp. MALMAid1274]|uniref:M13 family metallopeptidase n=1 Tax=Arenimonas sp. MALMAid1274 TaxID=3411630 RepID=UPI003BA0762F